MFLSQAGFRFKLSYAICTEYMLDYVEACCLLELEFEDRDNFLLHVDDFSFAEFFTADFIVDCVNFEGVDLFILGGEEHRSDTNKMKVGDL